jgi:hypothetical protein
LFDNDGVSLYRSTELWSVEVSVFVAAFAFVRKREIFLTRAQTTGQKKSKDKDNREGAHELEPENKLKKYQKDRSSRLIK